MKTYRQLAMGLLTLLLCISLPSCSDDDNNGSQTNELTLNWEIEVSDDLLDVANIAYTLYEGQEEMPEPELLVANSTGSKVTGKAPCTLGAIFALAPKEKPDTQKASYDLSLSVKVSVTNEKGQAVASSFNLDKRLKGVPADQIEKSLRSLQKLLDSAESLYIVDASGQVETASLIPEPEKVSDLQALQEALYYTDESGKQQPLLGQALDAARPDVLSVRVNDLEDAKATFLRWMPNAKQVIATGDNLTWTLTDEKGNTLGKAYFTATDDNAKGVVAKVTFDAAVKPQDITQINFLLSSAWPMNSTLKHRMGARKVSAAIYLKPYRHNGYDRTTVELTSSEYVYCIQDAYDDELAYYVGFGKETHITDLEGCSRHDYNHARDCLKAFASEQHAKNIQDILNKPTKKGGLGWNYYENWFKSRDMDITACWSNAWYNKFEEPTYWHEYGFCWEIDLNNGYQDYELTSHGIWIYETRLPMYVLVYRGDQLISGVPIE